MLRSQLARAVRRVTLLCFAVAALPTTAVAAPLPDPAAPMYQPQTMVVIDLDIPPASVQALEEEEDHGDYHPAEFSLSTPAGTPAGVEATSTPLKVEVRLKGHFNSSFRPLTEKAAFKLKFNKTERYLELKKMTLNNMVEDPSMIHETLAYSLYRAAGVPASHTGYAYLRVNGEDFGVYLNIETLDDLAMEKRFDGVFDDPQHLYEGEAGNDVVPGGAPEFEVDEGDEADRSDLEALIAAVNSEAGTEWLPQVTTVADLREMTRMWAVDKYAGFWDGYAGQEGASQPNNYYLYSDPLGVFQMFPWGTDETWERRLSFDGPAGVMFTRCLADPGCAAMYREALFEVRQAVAGLDLDSLAAQTAAQLQPWQQLEGSRREYSAAEIAEGVAQARAFIAGRRGELAAWLGIDESGPAAAPPLAPIPSAAARRLRVDRSRVVDGVLVTHLDVPAAGRVEQRVKFHAPKGLVGACATKQTTAKPGALTLRCPLSRIARRHIAARWLQLAIETSFRPLGGTEEGRSYSVKAHRAS
jgi:CotH kinase protein